MLGPAKAMAVRQFESWVAPPLPQEKSGATAPATRTGELSASPCRKWTGDAEVHSSRAISVSMQAPCNGRRSAPPESSPPVLKRLEFGKPSRSPHHTPSAHPVLEARLGLGRHLKSHDVIGKRLEVSAPDGSERGYSPSATLRKVTAPGRRALLSTLGLAPHIAPALAIPHRSQRPVADRAGEASR